tara:strand:+ start:373 stop:1104 length:732 start_codon:yes stop_codon:yes gene_type:complete
LKISIITITYNSESTILDTLKSIKSQKFSNYNHIIIDGNSTDKTLDICKKFSPKAKIISENDKGVYDAFNKGLRYAKGDIVGFLNSDDVFYDKNVLQAIFDAFDNKTDAVFGNLDYVGRGGRIIRKWRSRPFKKGSFQKGWMPPHPTFYCKRKVYDELGFYDDSFKIAGDFELMLRFFEKNNIRTKLIYKTLIKMREGGLSNSGLRSKINILKEEFRAFEQNQINISKLEYIINKSFKIKEYF